MEKVILFGPFNPGTVSSRFLHVSICTISCSLISGKSFEIKQSLATLYVDENVKTV